MASDASSSRDGRPATGGLAIDTVKGHRLGFRDIEASHASSSRDGSPATGILGDNVVYGPGPGFRV